MKKTIMFLVMALVGLGAKAQGNDGGKPLTFYAGGGYTLRSLCGLTVAAGAAYRQHDVQLSYTIGLAKSDPVYWYNDAGVWLATMAYKQSSLNVAYGYRIALAEGLSVVPQLGYRLNTLKASLTEGTGSYGDGAKSSALTVGGRLLYEPVQHVGVFLSPDFAVPLSQDTYFKHTADISNFAAGGFSVTAGVMFSF